MVRPRTKAGRAIASPQSRRRIRKLGMNDARTSSFGRQFLHVSGRLGHALRPLHPKAPASHPRALRETFGCRTHHDRPTTCCDFAVARKAVA